MQSQHRYSALVGGFGCGKSVAVALKVWRLAHQNPGLSGMLVSRSATQLRKLITECHMVFRSLGLRYAMRGHDEIHIEVGDRTSIVYLGTAENRSYERWAGGNLAFVVIDEFDTINRAVDVWSFANDRVRVAGAGLLQTAIATTPEGYGATWAFF